MAVNVDYYKTLEIPRTASKDEIRKAYRKLSKKHHPDANVGDEDALQKFKEVQQAWDVLGNEEKRKNYDQYGSPDGPRFSGASGGQQYRNWSDEGGEIPFDIEELFSGFHSRQGSSGGARSMALGLGIIWVWIVYGTIFAPGVNVFLFTAFFSGMTWCLKINPHCLNRNSPRLLK